MNTKEQSKNGFESLIQHITAIEEKFNDYEFPKISVVIPTFDCSQIISITVESVLVQKYPDVEIIIIDAGSTDRTLEVIKGYRDSRIRIYTVSEYRRYEMLNKGISQAEGEYINFLFPGDFYTHSNALKHIMGEALEHNNPHLVFCGTLLRDGRRDVRILYRHLSQRKLRIGQQPTSLQSCWFKAETFRVIGKFDTTFQLRGGFDLFCRYSLEQKFQTRSINWVLTDYDLRQITSEMVITHFKETWRVIYKYFGVFSGIWWLFIQKDIFRFIKLWLRSFRIAIIGR